MAAVWGSLRGLSGGGPWRADIIALLNFNSGRVSGRLFLIKKKTDAAAGGLIGARIYVVARVVVRSSITISVVFELNPVGPISGPFLFLLYSLR